MASILIPCIEDGSYIASATAQATSIIAEATVWAAIQVAMMAAQRASTGAIADMEAEIAGRRVALAEDLLAHAKQTWAHEAAFVGATMSVGRFNPHYGQAQVMLNEAQRTEALAIRATRDNLARMGITADSCDELRVRRGTATSRTDLVSHSMRSAEARALMLNDRRFSRQYAVVSMGRGQLQAALTIGGLTGGAQASRGALWQTLNSGMALWGYSANRWRHGGNFVTGENGAPRVVPAGHSMVSTTDVNGSRSMVIPDRLADAMTNATTSPSMIDPSLGETLRESANRIDDRDR